MQHTYEGMEIINKCGVKQNQGFKQSILYPTHHKTVKGTFLCPSPDTRTHTSETNRCQALSLAGSNPENSGHTIAIESLVGWGWART